MRIGLKHFLIFFTLIVCAIAWYKNHRDAKMGFAVLVPTPVKLSGFYEIPESIREFRGRSQARNHELVDIVAHSERELDTELALASVEFLTSRIRGQIPPLLKHRKEGLLKIARSRLNDKMRFGEAALAAQILDDCGDKSGLAYVKKRFLLADAKDKNAFTSPQRKKLSEDAKFLNALKLVPEDSPTYRDACDILYEGGFEQPLFQLRLKIAKEQKPNATHEVQWLLKHQLSNETLRLALDYLTDVPERGINPFFAEDALTVVPTDELRHDPEFQGLQRDVELALCDYVTSKRKLGQSGESIFFILAKHGTELSADVFRTYEITGETKYIYGGQRILSACQMLQRIGQPEDASSVFRKALSRPSGSAALPAVLYERAEEYLPRSEIIDSCMRRCRESADRNAIDYLSRACEGTGNLEVAQAILDATEQSNEEGTNWKLDDLKYVRRIGHPRIGELWSRIPAAEKATDTGHFYEQWVANDTKRPELIDWINRRLSPAKPLAIPTVLKAPKYKDNDLMWDRVDVWHNDEIFFPGIQSDHQFAAMALAHSGVGNLVNPDWYNLIAVARGLSKCADIESEEFQWNSHLDDSREAFFVSFVVNDCVYEFSIPNDDYYVEDCFSYRAAAEILNAVAIRQRLKGRFFCYETEWAATMRSPNNCFKLIVYLEQKVAMELESKFGMRPMAGFEYYFNH